MNQFNLPGSALPSGAKGEAEEAAEIVESLGEMSENLPSAAKAVLILLDLCTG